MRLLVTIAHYFKQDSFAELHRGAGSGRSPFARIAALNEQIVALNKYYGSRCLSLNPDRPPPVAAGNDTLDIVVMTVPGANLLGWIGIDPATYTVAYFDGVPRMLPFEAQRIMRERAGGYDLYGYFEDDLIIDDPAFFAKIAWFAEKFGPNALLMPVRYEFAHTGTPTKVAIDHRLSSKALAPFRRMPVPTVQRGSWNGREQTFRLPQNPHSGCFVVTETQLKLWMGQPSFYDRDVSWIGPLESASTYSPGKVFGLYIAAEPDPWFLQIEHYGTRYAATIAPPGEIYGEPPLLAMVEAAAQAGSEGIPQALASMGVGPNTMNNLLGEAAGLRHRLRALESSRSKLAKALVSAVWRKLRAKNRTGSKSVE
jgi:hypothetical protein